MTAPPSVDGIIDCIRQEKYALAQLDRLVQAIEQYRDEQRAIAQVKFIRAAREIVDLGTKGHLAAYAQEIVNAAEKAGQSQGTPSHG